MKRKRKEKIHEAVVELANKTSKKGKKPASLPKRHDHAINEVDKTVLRPRLEIVNSSLFCDTTFAAALFSPLSAALCKALDATDAVRPQALDRASRREGSL